MARADHHHGVMEHIAPSRPSLFKGGPSHGFPSEDPTMCVSLTHSPTTTDKLQAAPPRRGDSSRAYWSVVLEPSSSMMSSPEEHNIHQQYAVPFHNTELHLTTDNNTSYSPQGRSCSQPFISLQERKTIGDCNLMRWSAPEYRQNQCHRCSRHFSQSSHLNQHMRAVHENLKPNKCGLCRRPFAKKHDLISHHSAVHSRARPFDCSICGKAFAKKSNMWRHVSSVHAPTPQEA